MQTIIIKTESEAAAKLLLAFLKTVRLIKSATLAGDDINASLINEPAEEYNWINPSRPATEDEIEQMLLECEQSPLLSAEQAKELTAKELAEWRAKK